MTFRLQSTVTGRLRSGAVYLFEANGTEGCLGMTIPSTELVAGAAVPITLQIDIANEFCPLPLDTDRVVFFIYGDEPLRSEQAFAIRYFFRP